jgi:hypothetical protein
MSALLRRFVRNRRGVAAVEFGLLAPLLCLMLGLSVEIGRLMISYRQFEGMVIGVSRHVARYPEYEFRARAYAQPIPPALFPQGNLSAVGISVDSLVKDTGAMREMFDTHILYGVDPGLAWQDYVRPESFAENEAVIFVGARYTYRPVMPFVRQMEVPFVKDVVILPRYGRSFPWNDGQVNDSLYVY